MDKGKMILRQIVVGKWNGKREEKSQKKYNNKLKIKKEKKRIKNKIENVENWWMTWSLMWLNRSVAIINITLQFLDVCVCVSIYI